MSEQNYCFYEFGPFRLDRQKRLLYRGGEIVPLKPKAFDTLLALVERSGQLMEKDELMKRLWPNTVVEEGNLTFNISTLRKALGDDPRQHQYIVTIPGEGYRFVAGVRAMFDEVEVRERTRVTVEEVDEAANGHELSEPSGKPSMTATVSSLPLAVSSTAVMSSTARRRLNGSGMLVVVSLVLVGAVFAFTMYWLDSKVLLLRGALGAPFKEMTITRLTNSGKATKAVLSPDGKYFVHVTEDVEGQSLWLRQVAVATASQQIVAPRLVEYWGLTFSPDGNYIFCVVYENNSGEASLYRVPVWGELKRSCRWHPTRQSVFRRTGSRSPFTR